MSRALVRWMIRLFPGAFRQRYGDELLDVLERRGKDVRERLGRRGAIRYWWRTVLDLVRTAVAERGGRVRTSPIRPQAGNGALSGLTTDVRVSWRAIRRRPGVPAVIVATLALAIGANTAVYSVVDTVLVEPLPYANPDDLVRIYTANPPNRYPFSMVDFLALREQQTTFERVAAFSPWRMTYDAGEAAERIPMLRVSADFFPLLGVTPVAGRAFGMGDDAPEAPPVVVLAHEFWRTRFGGRSDVIGRSVRLDGVEHVVLGVVADVGPVARDVEAFVPLRLTPPSRKGPFFLRVIGRYRPGVAADGASRELEAINRRIFPVWRESYQDERATWSTEGLHDYLVGNARTTLLVVQGAVGLVLLIACSNVANLLLTRVGDRSDELAIRAALGASRGALRRLLFVESAIITVAGGGAGIGLAALAVPMIRWLGAGRLPGVDAVTLDGEVLLLSGAIIAFCAMVFGMTPLVGRPDRASRHLGASRRVTEGRASHQVRRGLVVLQVAVAVPLVFGAALMARTLGALQRVDPGFQTDGVLTVSVTLPASTYPELADVARFWERALERLGTVPGIHTVAVGDGRPPAAASNWNNFDLEDRPTPAGESQPVAPWVTVSSEFFRVLDVPLMAGRLFEEADRDDAPSVVTVDQTWVRRFFPEESPIGKRLRNGGCTTCPWTTVVGVVGDVKFAGLDDDQLGTVYFPFALAPFRSVFLYVRTTGEPLAVWPAVRAELSALDPSLAPTDVVTGVELVRDAIAPTRQLMGLVMLFALVAALVAAVGIHGTLAHYVQRQTRAIGIRLALGGAPRVVAVSVAGRGLVLVTAGCALGAIVGLGLARGLSGLIYGVTPRDLPSLVGAVAVLVAAAVVACLAPVLRASRVDPIIALRAE